ncbi:hypothetical protein EPUS_07205 [Endocarpon pusillum Z07020]|uniref:Uncharacterized protein n=1 Tax=Endocarpon pusillum (strain Z07020 / HMAS-L-300199) TaxID=1263415 RepID=U1GN67_ENDPU|nr:uncharacterized protein EPUS_07205 [Endocarpon pusillum Z07020]ERF73371.1 hypothetical protein EPUS_07205 [Endocarpon pusillum Z07020]
MGFFGSSRKKARDPFQAAVEQHQRGASSARLRGRQSGSARHDVPFAWCDSDNVHPYGQPGFGFYSGENLAAGTSLRTEPKRPRSVDEDFRDMGPRYPIDSWGAGLPFSTYQSYPRPSSKNIYARDIPYLELGPRAQIGPRDLPYTGSEELRPYLGGGGRNEFAQPEPTSMAPLGRLLPCDGDLFSPRRTPLDLSASAERPIFDHFPQFRRSPTPNRYPIPNFNANLPLNGSQAWDSYADRVADPISGAWTNSWPSHPPGSYERLRPPHLQPGNSGGGGTRSSSSNIGQVS